MCLAWKMLGTLGRVIDRKSMPLKMLLSLNFRFELSHLYKSLLPSAKGLSFTLCNLYFEFESPSSLTKAPTRRHYDRT